MAAVNFEGSEWDPYFTAVFSEVGQTKNAKIKIACFVAGKDQYCCFFTCLGDLFALDEEFARNADDTTLWMHPALQASHKPGTKLGEWIKALLAFAHGGARGFDDVPSLPHDASAGGFRAGVCNTVVSKTPTEIAVFTTGHDLTGSTAFFEYVDANRAVSMVCSIILAGWPPLPWGHTGMGPVPAMLSSILPFAHPSSPG